MIGVYYVPADQLLFCFERITEFTTRSHDLQLKAIRQILIRLYKQIMSQYLLIKTFIIFSLEFLFVGC